MTVARACDVACLQLGSHLILARLRVTFLGNGHHDLLAGQHASYKLHLLVLVYQHVQLGQIVPMYITGWRR